MVLEGEVETLGERVGPHGVIFYPAGEPHGIHNPSESTARYVVFEFHGRQMERVEARPATSVAATPPNPPASLFTKLTDPQRWKRKLKRLFESV